MWLSIPLRLWILIIGVYSGLILKFLSDADVGAPLVEPTVSQWHSYDPEERRLIFTVAVVLATFAFVVLLQFSLNFLYQLGKIRLSPQTVAHRRNVMLAVSIMLLTEIFKIDPTNIGKQLPIPGEALGFAVGILCFFAFYSLIEYFFSFTSDYTLREKSSATGARAHLARFLIGLYRFSFEIFVPLLAFFLAFTIFLPKAIEFTAFAKNQIICNHPGIDLGSQQFKESTISIALDGMSASEPFLPISFLPTVSEMRIKIQEFKETQAPITTNTLFTCMKSNDDSEKPSQVSQSSR